MSTLTLLVPYDMATFDPDDIFNGTITNFTSTEVDYTGVSGQHYEFKGTGFSALFENAPLNGAVKEFDIDGKLALTDVGDIPSDPSFRVSVGEFGSPAWSGPTLVLANEFGTSGDDGLIVGADSTGYGGAGNDTLTAKGVQAVLDGGTGDDTLTGINILNDPTDTTATYRDAVGSGVRVNLEVTTAQNVGGGLGHDTLSQIQNLVGTNFSDHLVGNTGANTLNGERGIDILTGGGGNDTLITDNAASTLSGGGGDDTVFFNSKTGVTADLNLYSSIETVIGTNASDTLIGTDRGETFYSRDGDDTVHAGGGRDLLIADAGNDLYDGGAGSDTLSYSVARENLTVDLNDTGPQMVGPLSGTDTLVSIESLIGGRFNDTFTGNNLANALDGGVGDDVLDGGAGNDTLTGGLGVDTLTGGAGHDVFVFYRPNLSSVSTIGGFDTITDFNASQDLLEVGANAQHFVPTSITFETADLDAANFESQIIALVGKTMSGGQTLFITATSGDLSGQSFLLTNDFGGSLQTQHCLSVHFGGASDLTGFGTHDFI